MGLKKFQHMADNEIEVRKRIASNEVMASFIQCLGANESVAQHCAVDVPDSVFTSDNPAGSLFVKCANISAAETLKAECKENLTSNFVEVEMNMSNLVGGVMADLCADIKSPLCSFTTHSGLKQSFNYRSCIARGCTEAKVKQIFHNRVAENIMCSDDPSNCTLEIDCRTTPSPEPDSSESNKSLGLSPVFWGLGALLLIAVLAVGVIMWRKQANA